MTQDLKNIIDFRNYFLEFYIKWEIDKPIFEYRISEKGFDFCINFLLTNDIILNKNNIEIISYRNSIIFNFLVNNLLFKNKTLYSFLNLAIKYNIPLILWYWKWNYRLYIWSHFFSDSFKKIFKKFIKDNISYELYSEINLADIVLIWIDLWIDWKFFSIKLYQKYESKKNNTYLMLDFCLLSNTIVRKKIYYSFSYIKSYNPISIFKDKNYFLNWIEFIKNNLDKNISLNNINVWYFAFSEKWKNKQVYIRDSNKYKNLF